MLMVTKKEIADYLGISRTAVSLALNNSPSSKLSAETKQKILQAAKELGYREHDTSPRICYVLYNREQDDPRYLYHLKEIELLCSNQNYDMSFMNILPTSQSLQKLKRSLDSKKIDGYIVSGDWDEDITKLFRDTSAPYVFFGAPESIQKQGYSSISFDHRKLTCHAVRHLISLGHQQIALFLGSLEYEIHQEALAGYRDALEDANIPVNLSLVQISNEENGYELATRARMLGLEYSAVFCSNTIIQFGALQYLQSIGVSVPHDVSLIASGSSHLVKISIPQLTCIEISIQGIQILVSELINLIEGSNQVPLQIKYDQFSFFEGGTVAAKNSL